MPLAAPGYQFDHDGQTYYIPRVIQGDRRLWQIWANAHVLKQARENQQAVDRGWMSQSEFDDIIETVKRKISAGKYYPTEIDGAELYGTDAGFTAFIGIVMRRHDPRLSEKDIDKMIESVGGKQFMEYWALAQSDPLPAAPPAGGETSTPPNFADTSSSPAA